MKRNLLLVFLGLLIGWGTVPLLRADSSSEIRSYIAALRRIISLMEDVKVLDQQTADNTRAIREKLGAK